MPKETLNINDFSGGINQASNKRDIEDNEVVNADGLMSHHPGSMSLNGTLISVPGLHQDVGSFSDTYPDEGIPNLYYVAPGMGFRQIFRIKVKTSSGTSDTNVTFDTYSHFSDGSANDHWDGLGYHGLEVGAKLEVILSIQDSGNFDNRGNVIIVTEIDDDNEFKGEVIANGSTKGFTNGDGMYVALCGTYDPNSSMNCAPTAGPDNNRFLIKANEYGRFGFYSIGQDKFWYGRAIPSPYGNAGGLDPWFYDTRYTWDFTQQGDGTALEAKIINTKVYNLWYDSGVIRMAMQAPRKWSHGFMKRPVGLYGINEDRILFRETSKPRYIIYKGWYPLRSHILAPHEYHHTFSYENTSINYNGAGEVEVSDASVTLPNFRAAGMGADNEKVGGGHDSNGDPYDEKEPHTHLPHQFVIGVGHGNNASTAGEWQFATGNEHSKLGFGVSLLYDSLDPLDGSESNISPLTQAAGTTLCTMSGGGATNDGALYLYAKVYTGNVETYNTPFRNHFMGPGAIIDESVPQDTVAVAERRGSTAGQSLGLGQFGAMNPRVVGANIYLTETNEGKLEDPLYLAQLNFYGNKNNKYGRTQSHDGILAEPDSYGNPWHWAERADGSTQWKEVDTLIAGIPSLPVRTYRDNNQDEYRHEENLHTWYKTSAVVNRRLYAGNVSYFNKNAMDLKDSDPDGLTVPIHYPDRILRSPVNKFDILPESKYIETLSNDGQDIVKLESLGSNLLIFKHDDLIVMDCSGEIEVVVATYRGYGITNPLQVAKTPNSIYWMSSTGIFTFDGENPPINVIREKIPSTEWLDNIWNNSSHLAYEPQENLLLAFTRWKGNPGDSPHPNQVLSYNIDTEAVFHKSSLGITRSSASVLANSKLYVGTTTLDDNFGNEVFNNLFTPNVPGTKAKYVISFKMKNTSSPGTWGGAQKFLVIKKNTGGWVYANTTPFIEVESGSVTQQQAAITTCGLAESYLNSGPLDSDYHFEVGSNHESDPDNLTFDITVEALAVGTAFSLVEEDLSGGSYPNYGTTALGFRDAASDATPNTQENITSNEFTSLTAGVNATPGVWTIYADRSGKSTKNTSYNFHINFGTTTSDDEWDGGSWKTSYKTGHPIADHSYIPASSGSVYADDSTGVANTDNERIVKNIREFLMNNPIIDENGQEHNLQGHFTFGTATQDSGGGTLGSEYSGNWFFTMTVIANSSLQDWTDLALLQSTTGGRGGKLVRWENNKTRDSNNVLLETKDYDFGEPNVRKKVYKAYLTYKGAGTVGNTTVDKMAVYYKVNQVGDFTLATVADSTVNGMIDISKDNPARAEISFGTAANNIYSIALQIKSTAPCDAFEVNDISFVYRLKRPK